VAALVVAVPIELVMTAQYYEASIPELQPHAEAEIFKDKIVPGGADLQLHRMAFAPDPM